MPIDAKSEQVQEMEGLYGPFTIAERVVQKLWLRRDFEQAGLRLLDGRMLQIRTPGHWNLLGGPDFHLARLLMDGRALSRCTFITRTGTRTTMRRIGPTTTSHYR